MCGWVAFHYSKAYSCFFIVDVGKKQIFYCSQFWRWIRKTPFLSFSQIQAITLTGRRDGIKGTRTLGYSLILIDDRGKPQNFSNSKKEAHEELSQQGKDLAEVFGCEFWPCPPKFRLHAIAQVDGLWVPQFESSYSYLLIKDNPRLWFACVIYLGLFYYFFHYFIAV